MQRTCEGLRDAFKRAGVNEVLAVLAANNVFRRRSAIIGMSGKMYSGKDSLIMPVAANVQEELIGVTHTDPYQAIFGRPLKNEVTEIVKTLEDLYTSRTLPLISKIAPRKYGVAPEELEHMFTLLRPRFEQGDVDISGWERSPEVRGCLQHWGTDVRRKYDDLYWVNKVINEIAYVLAEGNNVVYISDARFPNEVSSIRDVGGEFMRLDISDDLQREFALSRDGYVPGDEVLRHSSEVGLDDYDGFLFRLRVDDYVGEFQREISDATRGFLTHLR